MPLLPAHPSGASEAASIVAPDEPAAPSPVAPADASDATVVPDSTSELQLDTAVENRPTTIAATRTSDPFMTFTWDLAESDIVNRIPCSGDPGRSFYLAETLVSHRWQLPAACSRVISSVESRAQL